MWSKGRSWILASTSKDLLLEYQDFEDLFKKREEEVALSKYKFWDYKISILEGKESNYYLELRLFSKKKEDFLKQYIDKYIVKRFIRSSNSPILYSIVFVAKKDSDL